MSEAGARRIPSRAALLELIGGPFQSVGGKESVAWPMDGLRAIADAVLDTRGFRYKLSPSCSREIPHCSRGSARYLSRAREKSRV